VIPAFLPAAADYARLLAESFARVVGRPLCSGEPALALWNQPRPLVSHGTEADPIFRYANRAALTLWQMDWDAFTRLPSRLSAESAQDIQSDRDRYLSEAAARGFVESYAGIRISATGQRFRISETVLWTVSDALGRRHGQAALIGRVERL
jgi:class 3 adenylate cyclase